MDITVLKKPKLTAVVKSSGIESPVLWIDLEQRRCKTTTGLEADLDVFNFRDSRDYDEMRGEYAGRMMQAMATSIIGNTMLMEQYAKRATRKGYRNLSELMASDAVGWADALISELKRPRDYKEVFGVIDKKDG